MIIQLLYTYTTTLFCLPLIMKSRKITNNNSSQISSFNYFHDFHNKLKKKITKIRHLTMKLEYLKTLSRTKDDYLEIKFNNRN